MARFADLEILYRSCHERGKQDFCFNCYLPENLTSKSELNNFVAESIVLICSDKAVLYMMCSCSMRVEHLRRE